jgi:hypothetical protein
MLRSQAAACRPSAAWFAYCARISDTCSKLDRPPACGQSSSVGATQHQASDASHIDRYWLAEQFCSAAIIILLQRAIGAGKRLTLSPRANRIPSVVPAQTTAHSSRTVAAGPARDGPLEQFLSHMGTGPPQHQSPEDHSIEGKPPPYHGDKCGHCRSPHDEITRSRRDGSMRGNSFFTEISSLRAARRRSDAHHAWSCRIARLGLTHASSTSKHVCMMPAIAAQVSPVLPLLRGDLRRQGRVMLGATCRRSQNAQFAAAVKWTALFITNPVLQRRARMRLVKMAHSSDLKDARPKTWSSLTVSPHCPTS